MQDTAADVVGVDKYHQVRNLGAVITATQRRCETFSGRNCANCLPSKHVFSNLSRNAIVTAASLQVVGKIPRVTVHEVVDQQLPTPFL